MAWVECSHGQNAGRQEVPGRARILVGENQGLLEPFFPVLDLFFRNFFFDAVAFLHLAD